MPDAGTNEWSLAADHAINSLRDCASFRTWCGVDDEGTEEEQQTEALTHIHEEGLDGPRDNNDQFDAEQMAEFRPYAIVSTQVPGAWKGRSDSAGGGAFGYQHEGVVVIEFEKAVPAIQRDQPGALMKQFRNEIGDIIAEMLAKNPGAGDYLAISEFEIIEEATRIEPDLINDYGDCVFCTVALTWRG